ncbi:MAG TPA: DUF1236 domain-containing protein [Hyphomicrobiales bacterium]|nr:DUF1236 domain-containing protein [Hyphomicrobiales bacterium]
MNIYLKCSVSALALFAGISLANAQMSERQGSAAPNVGERPAGERQGGTNVQSGRQGGNAMQERSAQGQAHGQTRSTDQGQPHGQAPATARGQTAQRGGTATQREDQNAQKSGQQNQNARREARTPQGNEATQKDERTLGAQGQQGNVQRRAGVSGAGRAMEGGREHVRIQVNQEQKTRIHDVILRDRSLHRYRRSDIKFAVVVGERVPNTVVLYDPPPQLIEIDPDFRYYKIIVIDDEILVIDSATREIVDVIEI